MRVIVQRVQASRVEVDGAVSGEIGQDVYKRQAQTPQVFSVAVYKAAVERADREQRDFTDDCQLLEYAGMPVQMVKGSYDNIKITTPEDLAIAQSLLAYQYGWEDERDDADWTRIDVYKRQP